MLDKHGNLLEAGQDVSVPEPNENDTHLISFVGYVADVLETRGTVIVEDKCSDFHEIDGNRVVIKSN